MKKKYTNPRSLLKVEEEPLYDLMLRTSQLLPVIAKDGLAELDEMANALVPGLIPPASLEREIGLHKMLTYAFTLGVSFAVQRQVEIAGAALKRALKEKN